MGASLSASIKLSDPNCEPEVIWLKEGTIFGPILKKGEQQVRASVFYPSCHHDECSDHDLVSGFERQEKGAMIAIVISIWISHGVQHGNFGLCSHERLACDRGPGDHINHENGFKNDNNPVHGDNHHNLERVYLKNS